MPNNNIQSFCGDKYEYVQDAENSITIYDRKTQRFVQVVIDSPYCRYKFLAVNECGRVIETTNILGNVRQAILLHFEQGDKPLGRIYGYIQGRG